MSNKKKTRNKTKVRRLTGPPGSRIGVDDKGRAYRVLSPGGLQPGAVAGRPIKRGLDGTYRDTCVSCMQPTDTALFIVGPAEAQIAFLKRLGMPYEEALALCQMAWKEQGIWDGNPAHVPGGELTEGFRVCAACAPDGMQVREIHGPVNFYRFPEPSS